MSKIIIPITIAGNLTGFNPDTQEVERGDDLTIHFDLSNANGAFGRFVAAQKSKDQVAPAYNLLNALVIEDDRSVMQERIQNDTAAIMSLTGEVVEVLMPNTEKTQKKHKPSLNKSASAG